MPERFEADPYKDKYNNLLRELAKYNVLESDFNYYLYILEDDIKKEIEKAGRVPQYAYRMIIKEALPYDYKGSVYLELICNFEIIDGRKDDVTVAGLFVEDFMDKERNIHLKSPKDLYSPNAEAETMMPNVANAVMNLTTGEHSASIDWIETK